MKKLRWIWFFIVLIFYTVPRIFYFLNVLLKKEKQSKDEYEKYIDFANDTQDMKNVKWWQI